MARCRYCGCTEALTRPDPAVEGRMICADYGSCCHRAGERRARRRLARALYRVARERFADELSASAARRLIRAALRATRAR